MYIPTDSVTSFLCPPMDNQWRRQRSKGTRSFRGQKILQSGHVDALFSSKKVDNLFCCRPQNTGRQRRFTVKIKQIKRSDIITFLFSVHTITEAKQYAGLGRAEPGIEPGRWIFQPGHFTWRALVYRRHCGQHLSCVDCLKDYGEDYQNCSVLYCAFIVSAPINMHSYEQLLQVTYGMLV